MRRSAFTSLLPLFLGLGTLHAMEPLVCPGGLPLGRFDLTVAPPDGDGAPLDIQTVNEIFPGARISYSPLHIESQQQKKVRITLLLVPSDGSKVVVFDPRPADEPTSWNVPFRTQLASLVWGPQGLSKSKVTSLVTKNTELIGSLADYAAKTEETQSLLEAITDQKPLANGQNLDAAVSSFASQYPAARIDPTQPPSVQLNEMLHGVNPSLTAYDPLASSPQQQAAQTAGLAAAVAGLFFGNGVGLAATGGAVLMNLHGVFFPDTQFLSALAQTEGRGTGLCGSKAPPAPRTEFAYLWAMRMPDTEAPYVSLRGTEHLPLGVKSTVPLDVRGQEWKLASRIRDWKLVSDDNRTSVPVAAQLNASSKTIELDLQNPSLKPGSWKLAASWDWNPVPVPGALMLHDLPRFSSAHLTPSSQDELIAGAGTLDLELTGDDFEFVKKLEYRKQNDPFAQRATVPFQLKPDASAGPQNSLKLRLDAKTLSTGNYEFLIAQADGQEYQTPFRVLAAAPTISGTPLTLNTGLDSQTITWHGTGLDRIEEISSDYAQFSLTGPGRADERTVSVKLDPAAKAGDRLVLRLKVKDYEEPVNIEGAFVVAGPRPAITGVRASPQAGLGVALNQGEIAAGSLVSFELGVAHAQTVSAVNLSCAGAPEGTSDVRIVAGDLKNDAKLTQESSEALFLSFRPENIGQPGCAVQASLITPNEGSSDPKKLGSVVRLPRIDTFQLTSDKANDSAYYAVLTGQNLEILAKVGWDARSGTPVDSIPAPVAGQGNSETLRVALPWPAPVPHAPLYVWLRGESRGRLTTAQF